MAVAGRVSVESGRCAALTSDGFRGRRIRFVLAPPDLSPKVSLMSRVARRPGRERYDLSKLNFGKKAGHREVSRMHLKTLAAVECRLMAGSSGRG